MSMIVSNTGGKRTKVYLSSDVSKLKSPAYPENGRNGLPTVATTSYVYAGSRLISTETGSGTTYVTLDHLGSTRVTTDGGGNVTSRKDFMAFGEEAITVQRNVGVGYGTPPVRQDYTGYEKEAESGLEFAQARYQNPVHGRFTSVDPLTASATIKNPQTFNRYTYALNSPYKFTDPLGLLSQYSTGACGTFCGNGSYVDGSAIRGRDARNDWFREFFGEVAGYALDQPDGSVVVNDATYVLPPDGRPFVGDMAKGTLEVVNGDTRFGSGHDGSHWLTEKAGTDIVAIAGLTGTILTYYTQNSEAEGAVVYSVLILLKEVNMVFILKDLGSLGPKVNKAPKTYPGHTAIFKKNGSPISKITLNVGDVIGTTSKWTGFGNDGGLFHFTFLDAAFVQQFRNLKARGGDIYDGTPAEIKAMEKQGYVVVPKSWFVDPCGSGSPLRCK